MSLDPSGSTDASITPAPQLKLPIPSLGEPSVLVPIDGGEVVAGEVTRWIPGAGGLIVTAQIQVGVGAARMLAGHNVWLRITVDGTLVVLRAQARISSNSSSDVELTGVQTLAVETRRAAVRARMARPILLMHQGKPTKPTHTLDVSATGCRVKLTDEHTFEAGDLIDVALTDSAGNTLHLRSEVVRIDTATRQAGLSFIDLDEHDRETLDRDVLSWHDQHGDDPDVESRNGDTRNGGARDSGARNDGARNGGAPVDGVEIVSDDTHGGTRGNEASGDEVRDIRIIPDSDQ